MTPLTSYCLRDAEEVARSAVRRYQCERGKWCVSVFGALRHFGTERHTQLVAHNLRKNLARLIRSDRSDRP